MDFASNKFTNYFLDTSFDISREAYKNKNKNNELDNKSVNRFETDVILNSSGSFESNNKIINGLQDEILYLKRELKTINEKEEEIYKLKFENNKLKKDQSKISQLENDISVLKSDNKRLRDKNDNLKVELINIQSLRQENKMLLDKLEEISNDEGMDKEIKTQILEDKSSKEDENERKDEIEIDIHKLKIVLSRRLKRYHDKHIDDLIKLHELRDKETIDKKTMEKILLDAIHI